MTDKEKLTACGFRATPCGGFTLIELLVVIAIIGILAAILLPVLALAKRKAYQAVCLNNEKQLAMAWRMYADDNAEYVVGFGTALGPIGGTAQNWRTSPEYIQPAISLSTQRGFIQATGIGFEQPYMGPPEPGGRQIMSGPLYQYASNPNIIHCPGDLRATMQPCSTGYYTGSSNPDPFGFSWDSYSGVADMNGMNGTTGGLVISKATQLRHFSDRILWVEECDSRGDNGGSWEMQPNPAANGDPGMAWMFLDSPASFHGVSSTFNFADGHAEARRWLSGAVVALALSMDPNKYTDSLITAADVNSADQYWVSSRYPTMANP